MTKNIVNNTPKTQEPMINTNIPVSMLGLSFFSNTKQSFYSHL